MPRWRGFAAALNHGFAEQLVMLGGIETLPRDSVPPGIDEHFVDDGKAGEGMVHVPRGFATVHGLNKLFGVRWHGKMDYVITDGNTGGNVAAVEGVLKKWGFASNHELVGISTNLYHLPRAFMDFHAAGLHGLKPIPAEAFWLATTEKGSPERKEMLDQLREEFQAWDRESLLESLLSVTQMITNQNEKAQVRTALLKWFEALPAAALVERVVDELGGAADKLLSAYVPRDK